MYIEFSERTDHFTAENSPLKFGRVFKKAGCWRGRPRTKEMTHQVAQLAPHSEASRAAQVNRPRRLGRRGSPTCRPACPAAGSGPRLRPLAQGRPAQKTKRAELRCGGGESGPPARGEDGPRLAAGAGRRRSVRGHPDWHREGGAALRQRGRARRGRLAGAVEGQAAGSEPAGHSP